MREGNMLATGTFEVKLTPQTLAHSIDGLPLARMSLDKTFSGDLEAVSNGEMTSAGTQVKGSAGYVAMEWVRGTLHGRKGGFVLQHSATMNRGVPEMHIAVVPDSGTGELLGLAGNLTITVTEGKH
ncbi:MAG TPA: DUF3224 domain-containing protein, partial [Burkholderiaceae bacterium]